MNLSIGGGRYNIWKRNRKYKQGGGEIMLVKNMVIDEVTYGEGSAEVLRVGIKRRRGGKKDYAVVYVPPKTKSWSTMDYRKMFNGYK